MLLSRTNRNRNRKLKRQNLNLFPMLLSVAVVSAKADKLVTMYDLNIKERVCWLTYLIL